MFPTEVMPLLITMLVLERSTQGEKTCPKFWKVYPPDLSCFHNYSTPKTWMDASDHCMLKEAQLLKIMDMGKQTLLKELLSKNRQYWIGVSDLDKDGSFHYVNGLKLNSSQPGVGRWAKSAYNPASNNVCISYNPAQDTWVYNDCDQQLAFLCEILRPGANTTNTDDAGPDAGSWWLTFFLFLLAVVVLLLTIGTIICNRREEYEDSDDNEDSETSEEEDPRVTHLKAQKAKQAKAKQQKRLSRQSGASRKTDSDRSKKKVVIV